MIVYIVTERDPEDDDVVPHVSATRLGAEAWVMEELTRRLDDLRPFPSPENEGEVRNDLFLSFAVIERTVHRESR